MKKTLTIALAMILCGMMNTSYAKVIPESNTTPNGITMTSSGNIIVDLSKTGTALNWTAFDLEKGHTATFYGAASSVNTISSKSSSSILGTITASNTKNDFLGTITFVNAKGFSIGNSFVFRGKEINFNLASDKNIVNIKPGGNGIFSFASGNLNIDSKGAVSGGMSINAKKAGTEVTINAGENNVTVGNITSYSNSKLSITGKDIRTGNLDAALNNSTITVKASGSITTGNITGNAATFDFDAAKDITTKIVTLTNSSTATFDSTNNAGRITVGNVITKSSNFTIATAKSVNTSVMNLTAGEVSFKATDGISTKAIDSTATLTLDGGTSTRIGGLLKVFDNTTKLKGTKTVNVDSAEIAKDKSLIINAATGFESSAVTTGNLSNQGTITVYGKSISTKAITNDTSATSANFTAEKSFSAADVTITSGTFSLAKAETAKLANVTMDGNTTLTLNATKTINVTSIVSPETTTSSDAATVTINGTDSNTTIGAIDVANTFNVSIAAAKTNVGDITMAEGSFTVDGAKIQLGDANFDKAATILKNVTTLTTGDLTATTGTINVSGTAASSYRFGDIRTSAALTINAGTVGTVTAGNITSTAGAVQLDGKSIKLTGIDKDEDAFTATAYTALDLGTVELAGSGAMTFTSTTGYIGFKSLNDETTGNVNLTATASKGYINGGNITSNGTLAITAMNNVTLKNVELTDGSSTIYSTQGTIKFADLTVDADTTATLGADAAATDNSVYTTTMTNDGTVVVFAGTVTLNGLTNNNILNVTATSFSSNNMTEKGTSTIKVDSFKAQAYSSNANKTTNVEATTKFNLGSKTTANGTFNLNLTKTTIEGLSINIQKGAYFNSLVTPSFTVSNQQAAKQITSKNFKDANSWTARTE